MKNPFYRLVMGFLAAALLGLLFTGLYGQLPCAVTAVLAPNCQSPWELSKLAYFPLLGAVALTRVTGKEKVARRADLMLLVLTPAALFLVLWLAAALGAGDARLLLWLVALAAGLGLTGSVRAGKGDSLWWVLAAALGVAYVLFTFLPPVVGPFLDPTDVSAMATLPC